jgi:hypothetical protein
MYINLLLEGGRGLLGLMESGQWLLDIKVSKKSGTIWNIFLLTLFFFFVFLFSFIFIRWYSLDLMDFSGDGGILSRHGGILSRHDAFFLDWWSLDLVSSFWTS